ncbi:MAG TPA: site-specific integrase, partial [Planctomycetota bacterium]|nr:site-specific integrase [Planctomycetota bacterium]
MARTQNRRLPKIGRHSSGLARITLSGRTYYLGPHGSVEAAQRYAELVAKWEAGGRQPLDPAPTVVQTQSLRTVFEAWLAQLTAAGRYVKAGRRTSAWLRLARTVECFLETFGKVPAAKYTERLLLQHRDALEQRQKLTRTGINRMVGTLRDGLRWAYERGHIGRDAWLGTVALQPLSKAVAGHRDWRYPKRAPSTAEIQAVAAAAPAQIGRMLRTQYLLGCRPGELCSLRWSDLDRELIEGCWTYRVRDEVAKSSHHGAATRYAVPPAAQRLIEQEPVTGPGDHVFVARRRVLRGKAELRPWTTGYYRCALAAACKKAGVPVFSGHEVRH